MNRGRFSVLGCIVELLVAATTGLVLGASFDVLGFGVELVAMVGVRFDVLGFGGESVVMTIGGCCDVLGFGVEVVDSVIFLRLGVQGGDTDRGRFSRLMDVGSNSLW